MGTVHGVLLWADRGIGKTALAVAEASRAHDLPPSGIESWVDGGKHAMDKQRAAHQPKDSLIVFLLILLAFL